MRIIAIFLALFMASGCATKLTVVDDKNMAMKGIPVPKPQLVKVVKTTTFKAIANADHPELCTESMVVESYDYVSSDNHYFVNFDPSEFAKGTFEITFNDKGLLSKVAVNSEANTGGDVLSGLLETVVPYIHATQAEKLANEKSVAARADKDNALIEKDIVAAADLKKASCVEKKTTIELKPLAISP